jgi:hypothetical protein
MQHRLCSRSAKASQDRITCSLDLRLLSSQPRREYERLFAAKRSHAFSISTAVQYDNELVFQ